MYPLHDITATPARPGSRAPRPSVRAGPIAATPFGTAQ